MSHRIHFLLAGTAALAAGTPALAQAPAGASASPPAYRSAFEDYRPYQPQEVQGWRQANDTVREVGGWRAYAREIHGQPAAPAPVPAPPAAPQASPGHEGHHR
jgi:hypothetical protein